MFHNHAYLLILLVCNVSSIAWHLNVLQCNDASRSDDKTWARHRAGAAEDQASPVPGGCTAPESPTGNAPDHVASFASNSPYSISVTAIVMMFLGLRHRDRAVEDQASLYLAITQLMKAQSLVTSDCAYVH